MEKTYRRLRAKLHRRKEPEVGGVGGFLLRLFVCMVAFLTLAGIRLRGGELYTWTKTKIMACMFGAYGVVDAYNESVEAFNQFCDRILEARGAQ